eukprot:2631243-Amphidinium_carterae.3
MTGKQPPVIVAQLDDISLKKEITLENNEDKEEKNRMETVMKDIQVQPWWQSKDDITMFSEIAVRDAMNKELSQLMSKPSFKEVDSRTLSSEQLQQVVATGWVITQRPSNKRFKDIKYRSCGKGFSQIIHDTDIQTYAATHQVRWLWPRYATTTHNRHRQTIHSLHNRRCKCTPQHANRRRSSRRSVGATTQGVPQSTSHFAVNDKSTLRATHCTQTMAGTFDDLSTILQQLGFTRLESDACVFVNQQSSIYIMAYVDDFLVMGQRNTHKPVDKDDFTGVSWEDNRATLLQDDCTIHLSFSLQCYNKILKAYTMDKCNPSTTLGKKKPPIAAQPLDKEQHSMYRTAVGQLLWVSQLRVDIAFAVKELSRALQQPDNEDFKNLKQLLRYIKGTTHYKVTLSPKVEHNEQKQIKSTSGTITLCWGKPLLHISRTQSTIALSSAEAELYAMGQATIEAQHIKQVIEEMAIPILSPRVTMSINTGSSAGKAVASRLGLSKKTKHVHLRYLYMLDIVQRGETTITKIPTTHTPADVLTIRFREGRVVW